MSISADYPMAKPEEDDRFINDETGLLWQYSCVSGWGLVIEVEVNAVPDDVCVYHVGLGPSCNWCDDDVFYLSHIGLAQLAKDAGYQQVDVTEAHGSVTVRWSGPSVGFATMAWLDLDEPRPSVVSLLQASRRTGLTAVRRARAIKATFGQDKAVREHLGLDPLPDTLSERTNWLSSIRAEVSGTPSPWVVVDSPKVTSRDWLVFRHSDVTAPHVAHLSGEPIGTPARDSQNRDRR